MKKPANLYFGVIVAIVLLTVCFIDLEQTKLWLDLFVEMWEQ